MYIVHVTAMWMGKAWRISRQVIYKKKSSTKKPPIHLEKIIININILPYNRHELNATSFS